MIVLPVSLAALAEELVNNEEVMDVADRQDNEKRHAINGRLQNHC